MDTEITNSIKNGKDEVWSKKQTEEKKEYDRDTWLSSSGGESGRICDRFGEVLRVGEIVVPTWQRKGGHETG